MATEPVAQTAAKTEVSASLPASPVPLASTAAVKVAAAQKQNARPNTQAELRLPEKADDISVRKARQVQAELAVQSLLSAFDVAANHPTVSVLKSVADNFSQIRKAETLFPQIRTNDASFENVGAGWLKLAGNGGMDYARSAYRQELA